MYSNTEYRLISILAILSLSLSLQAQCPETLNNSNGNGVLSIYFAASEHPSNLVSVDVDFPTINGNHTVTNLAIAYQTTTQVFAGETLTGDLVLNYTSGPTLSCAYVNGTYLDPLPVVFSSFIGELEKDNIALNWRTESEKNNAAFDIERSFDGETFSIIGMVSGSGDSEMAQDYSYYDTGVKTRALSATAYYRLAQIDYDGTKTYSEVLAIDLGLDFEKFEITKITGWDSQEKKIQVHFYNPSNVRKIIFLLADINGRIIEQRPVYPELGLNVFEIDLSGQKSPFYFLSLNNGKNIIGEKIALGLDY